MSPTYPFSRYLNIRMSYFPSFRSDGRKLAFLMDLTGLPQVWQIGLTMGNMPGQQPWPEQITFESDRVMGAWFSPASGDNRLVYSRDTGGNENAQLFLLPEGGGREVALTAGWDETMHIPGDWAPCGRSMLVAANRRDSALFDLYLMMLNEKYTLGEMRLVWQNEEPGYLRGMTFDAEGERILLTRDVASFEADLFEVELETGQAHKLNPNGEKNRYDSPHFLPGRREAVVITDAGSDTLYAAQVDLESGRFIPVFAPRWDVESIALSPDGEQLACLVNVDGASELHLVELRSGQSRQMPAIDLVPGVIGPYFTDSGRMVFSPDGSLLAFSFTSATRPSDVFVWDLINSHVIQVTRSGRGGLPADAFTAPELVHFPTFDEDETGQTRQIPAWLYKPAHASGTLPVVVFVHGGPEGQFQPYLNQVIQYFAHRGFAVLAPNVRGSTGYGKAYSHLDDVRKRLDSVHDLACAAMWLKERPEFDGERLVVYGGSYGGFMVLAALTNYPELWAAGVDLVGIGNFVTFLERTSAYRRPHREAEYGSLAEDREFLKEISPLNHVERIRVPLMVIHGRNDPRVPFHEAEQLVAALQGRGVPVEFLPLDDEGHGIVKLKNKLVAFPEMVKFLEKNLKKS